MAIHAGLARAEHLDTLGEDGVDWIFVPTSGLQVRERSLAACYRSAASWAASRTVVRWRPDPWLHSWLHGQSAAQAWNIGGATAGISRPYGAGCIWRWVDVSDRCAPAVALACGPCVAANDSPYVVIQRSPGVRRDDGNVALGER